MFMVRNDIPHIDMQTVVDAKKLEELVAYTGEKMLETKQTRKIDNTAQAAVTPDLHVRESMFTVRFAC